MATSSTIERPTKRNLGKVGIKTMNLTITSRKLGTKSAKVVACWAALSATAATAKKNSTASAKTGTAPTYGK